MTESVPIISAHNKIPRHIAIIMDGNGRWAKERKISRVFGHRSGAENVREIVRHSVNLGVEYLTLFAFSSENWRRPPAEVSLLMRLFMTMLENEVDKLHQQNIRLKIIGERDVLSAQLNRLIETAENLTQNNTLLTLSLCINYGGKWDIAQAVKRALVENPLPANITEESLQPYLQFSYAPEPDLFIRTGGEQRVSNFMIWQLAYTELYFTPIYWPDFNRAALDLAIAWYQNRERRFGRTSEQLISS